MSITYTRFLHPPELLESCILTLKTL